MLKNCEFLDHLKSMPSPEYIGDKIRQHLSRIIQLCHKHQSSLDILFVVLIECFDQPGIRNFIINHFFDWDPRRIYPYIPQLSYLSLVFPSCIIEKLMFQACRRSTEFFIHASWMTKALGCELARRSSEFDIYLQNMVNDFEEHWLGIANTSQVKSQLQKFNEYRYTKLILNNLTNLTVYLKTKQCANKARLASILIKKLNNCLIGRRKENASERSIDDCFYQGLMSPFGTDDTRANSLLVV